MGTSGMGRGKSQQGFVGCGFDLSVMVGFLMFAITFIVIAYDKVEMANTFNAQWRDMSRMTEAVARLSSEERGSMTPTRMAEMLSPPEKSAEERDQYLAGPKMAAFDVMDSSVAFHYPKMSPKLCLRMAQSASEGVEQDGYVVGSMSVGERVMYDEAGPRPDAFEIACLGDGESISTSFTMKKASAAQRASFWGRWMAPRAP